MIQASLAYRRLQIIVMNIKVSNRTRRQEITSRFRDFDWPICGPSFPRRKGDDLLRQQLSNLPPFLASLLADMNVFRLRDALRFAAA